MHDSTETETYCVKWHTLQGRGLCTCNVTAQMLRMRAGASGYSGPGPAVMAHSAIIWHQTKHSAPLTFISLFYAVCVCPLWKPCSLLTEYSEGKQPCIKK